MSKQKVSMQRLRFKFRATKGDKAVFIADLVQALRSGGLEQDAALWLADFFENGYAENLSVKFGQNGRGNKKQRTRENIGAIWLFRMITEETPRKEDVFERAKAELDIGRNRAEEYWKRIKADIAREAEDEYRKEPYLEFKRLTLLERAEQGAPEPREA